MTIYEAALSRHAVRAYLDRKIEGETLTALCTEIDECGKTSGLSIQLVLNEPKAFTGLMAHYGGFRNVTNYIALVGKPNQKEQAGYYGEKIALKAQQLGLNTCWVAVTFKKKKCKAVIKEGQTLICVIAVGYGENDGVQHKSKPLTELCNYSGETTTRFKKGLELVALAPTALNKQDFTITPDGDGAKIITEKSSYSEINLGILKYHFELGADNA